MVAAAVLVILALLAAGCMSIPGPENTARTPAVTSPPALPVQTTVVPQKTAKPVPTTNPVPVTPAQVPGYETGTCAAQGGTVVSPGQKCPSAYLPATDSFSCCSKTPVAIGNGNTTVRSAPVTVLPLDLSIDLDDSPGSIMP
jgi:hypothetical protein